MIDNYLLEELVAFSEHKTLAAAAEYLNVTQPTLTRGMQKIENELQVTLFNRQKNRIILTDVGKVAAIEAKKVLASNQNFIQTVRNYAENTNTINISSTIPGPIIVVNSLKLTNANIDSSLIKPDNIEQLLNSYKFDLIFSTNEIFSDSVESRYLGREKLAVRIDKFHPLASQKTVTFKELRGLSFLVANDIGTWKDIIQDYIPKAKFLYQENLAALSELTQYSSFPVFRTNLSSIRINDDKNDGRRLIPISDEEATVEVYACYLKNNRHDLQVIFDKVSEIFSKNLPN
ncbi:LysR family transcriptional regulator [Lactobacillus salivarius]|uniref:LysR family transcriptional regulator n=1 Tax=Ligilactobacillus salivarius TaxID=1624 RepID=A0ABD6J341_9LACO|nr:LysR family transcriptional regulator [Ligilactobacillus salivarius]HBU67459.1 LysR family transcriptional regulator [Lactobacillus sp.]MBM6707824.1 LysR family transcriptional regulator [Ligilactobacillus salivarius]MDE1498524.1 LysR family transcriptional regulator [Ligilactobacillus salivarius]MDE1499654.1 LysR family transcriptional regulator [Ligilactobacillus salivarius]MDE1522944.1 LysR family transcriptional regulator [Ligilactobacillus salivarius]